jgi:hypothetical protein
LSAHITFTIPAVAGASGIWASYKETVTFTARTPLNNVLFIDVPVIFSGGSNTYDLTYLHAPATFETPVEVAILSPGNWVTSSFKFNAIVSFPGPASIIDGTVRLGARVVSKAPVTRKMAYHTAVAGFEATITAKTAAEAVLLGAIGQVNDSA